MEPEFSTQNEAADDLIIPGSLTNNDTNDNDTDTSQQADFQTEVDDVADGNAQEADSQEDSHTGEVATTEPEKPTASVQQTEQLQDPGEFKPNDYSFDVQLADGTIIKIEKPEDIDKLPNDADFGSPKNFLQVQANFSRMVNGLEADKREYDGKKQNYDQQVATEKERVQIVSNWEKEINYLESKGKLPAVPAQYKDSDWRNADIAKQPGVKERVAIFDYMVAENKAREAAGLPRMVSMLEAYNEMRSKALEESISQRQQQQADMRKKRGAMISGASTPASSSSIPSDMIVGRGGSLRDLS